MEPRHVDVRLRRCAAHRVRWYDGRAGATRHTGFGDRNLAGARDRVHGFWVGSCRWQPRGVSWWRSNPADIDRRARPAIAPISYPQTSDRSVEPPRTA